MRTVDLRLEKKFDAETKRSSREILVRQSGRKVTSEVWVKVAYRFNKMQGTRIPRSLRKECSALDPCYIHPKAKSKRKIHSALEARRKDGSNV